MHYDDCWSRLKSIQIRIGPKRDGDKRHERYGFCPAVSATSSSGFLFWWRRPIKSLTTRHRQRHCPPRPEWWLIFDVTRLSPAPLSTTQPAKSPPPNDHRTRSLNIIFHPGAFRFVYVPDSYPP